MNILARLPHLKAHLSITNLHPLGRIIQAMLSRTIDRPSSVCQQAFGGMLIPVLRPDLLSLTSTFVSLSCTLGHFGSVNQGARNAVHF